MQSRCNAKKDRIAGEFYRHACVARVAPPSARPIPELTSAAVARISATPDDRMAAAGGKAPAEESPGSTGMRCRPTAGGGDPRESATENIPPAHGTPWDGKGEMVR